MNLRLILGYVLLVVCLLALAAAIFLEVNNLGGSWTMQVFWRPVTLTPAVWLLLGAAGGVALWLTLTHLLPLSVRMIGRGRRTRRERLLKQALHEARQGQAGSAPSAGTANPAVTLFKYSASPNPTDEAEKR